MIASAEELVGYGPYIELLGPTAKAKAATPFPIGAEEDRCRYAIERAAEGRRVALVCSGDAGIYAMASLVFEILDRDGAGLGAGARAVEVVVGPGLTAASAAAARIGAPLGHDFCTISLSDLLTPRETILKRVTSAATGDYVIAFYNPASQRRRTLLEEARDLLLRFRPPETPVAIARSVGRPGESIRLTTLESLQSAMADMHCIILVGSSATRCHPNPGWHADVHAARLRPAGAEPGSGMTVYFIGAGPGDPELLTLRGKRLIERCPVCLYAGSLVPPSIVASAPPDALVRDIAPLALDEIMALIEEAHSLGKDVARVHSGDPCLYGAISEQVHRLQAKRIPYEIIPGVPAFAAAAAALGRELTMPGNRANRDPHPNRVPLIPHAGRRGSCSARANRGHACHPSLGAGAPAN